MMLAFTLPRLSLGQGALLRACAAGTIWGVAVSAALLALSFYQCGSICLGQIVDTTALSVLTGMLTIGPLALLQREAQKTAQ